MVLEYSPVAQAIAPQAWPRCQLPRGNPAVQAGPTAATGAGCYGQAADDFVAELVADLNGIEGVLAEAGQGEAQPGSKEIGSLLLRPPKNFDNHW